MLLVGGGAVDISTTATDCRGVRLLSGDSQREREDRHKHDVESRSVGSICSDADGRAVAAPMVMVARKVTVTESFIFIDGNCCAVC